MNKIQRLIERYQHCFDTNRAESIPKKILCFFMLAFPHLLACLILILISPHQWAAILLIGLIVPDFYFALYTIYRSIILPGKEYEFGRINLSMKSIAHIMLFILIILFQAKKDYILVLAGGLHLLTDALGF